MGVQEIATQLQTNLKALKPGGDGAVAYFDHVWIGLPAKIPMGDRRVCIIEAAESPTFYYTTCGTNTSKDTDFYITILSKGHVETSTKDVYSVTDAVLTSLYSNPKLDDKCDYSTVERVMYGDMSEKDGGKLLATSRIILRCRH